MQENTSVLAESYDLFNSSKIFSNMLADIDLKHNLGPDENQNLSLARLHITDLRFDVLLLRKHSAFIKVSCCLQDLALICERRKRLW